jgi:LysR family transcriptional regulator, glycine cleavage system transcriptional activator
MSFPPLHCLTAFEAVARLRSFAQAAAELHITPSAVSHRIKDLEKEIGETLFVRRARRIDLTIAGERYLADVRAALEPLARLARPRLGERRSEKLRVVAPPTFARQLLLPAFARFCAAYPHIEPELSLSIPFSEVKASDADVEIRFGDGRYGELETVKLFDESVFPVASPAYAQRLRSSRRGKIAPQQIAKAELLRNPRESWRAWFKAAGLDVPEPATGPLFNDLGLLVEAAAQGQGVALARTRLSQAWLATNAVVRLSDIEVRSPNSYYVVTSPGRREAATRFASWLLRELG